MSVVAASAASRAHARAAAESLAAIRDRAPRIHCITNAAASVLTANGLLAVGAVPSLTIAPEEVGDFVSGADALLINLGTLDETRRAAIAIAIEAATKAGIPWVLDPVFADRSPQRLDLAARLCALRPAVIHANETEIMALAEKAGREETGAAGAAAKIARDSRACVVLTGPEDRVCDATRAAVLSSGHPLMGKVTAMGCALGAVTAAFCAVERDPFLAALEAVLCFGVAGAMAGDKARGPGSFQAELLDALYALDAAAIEKRGRVK
ncbi:MAG: hydroxyethylthiazole kinase [Hyphomicrobiales bacterium]|nr:hydroxyethylthiazole kinase [Hyphomicrobiales bacterium]